VLTVGDNFTASCPHSCTISYIIPSHAPGAVAALLSAIPELAVEGYFVDFEGVWKTNIEAGV
jgi:hypothetical protein